MASRQSVSVVHIVTVPLSLSFFHDSAGYMKSRNMIVRFITSPGDLATQFADKEQVQVDAVVMLRRVAPINDLGALLRLWRLLREMRPSIVHVHTPKAGLLGGLAAWLAGVPIRIYQMRGLRYQGMSGYKQAIFKFIEFVTCWLAHRVISNSESSSQVLIDDGLISPEKIIVLHHGSGNGVNATTLFNPKMIEAPPAASEGVNIGFIGRLARDKGIIELTRAWQQIKAQNPHTRLTLIGSLNEDDAIPVAVRQTLAADDRVQIIGYKDKAQMPACYAQFDMVILPTYREGFPNVLLEAAAMELPVVATHVTGCVDAVLDGITGTLVPVHDVDALANAIQRYIDDPALRRQHGQAGRDRVLRDFRPEDIWAALYEEYERLLIEKEIWHVS